MKLKHALLGIAATATMAAQADQPLGPYAGGLFGSTEVEIGEIDYSADAITFGAFAGYQLTNHFAIEAGYLSPKTITETSGGDQLRIKVRSGTLSAIASIPATDVVSFHVRAGAARSKLKVAARVDGETESASDSATDLLFGGGIGFTLRQARARLEITRIDNDDIKGTVFSGSVAWYFGQK